MTLRKNVASQKLTWLMVDATDFATPEPTLGSNVNAYYFKDGGGRSTCSNTVSEITSGLYKITLAQTETNGDVMAYQFTGTGCADQFVIHYPDQAMTYASDVLSTLDDVAGSQIASILADTQTLSNATYGLDALETICSDIKDETASILADTITLSNATYGLDALETLVSQVASSIDDFVGSQLADILTDTATISNLPTTDLSGVVDSILEDVASILTDHDSILSDLIDISACCYSVPKDDLSGVVASILVDTANISNLGAGDDSHILSTLDQYFPSILEDTKETTSQADSILADTKTLSNATYGLDALESLASQILVDTAEISNLGAGDDSHILSTLDQYFPSILTDTQNISNISGDSGAISAVKDIVDSVLADTKTLSNATYGLDALESLASQILVDTGTTLDNRQQSILADTKETTSQCDSILADTKTLSNATYGLDALETLCSDIKDQTTSILADTVTLSNATYGLDALETLCSHIESTLDDVVGSQIADILTDTATISNIPTADLSGTLATVATDTATISNIPTTDLSGTVASILTDTGTTLDDKLDSTLANTISTKAWGLINSGVVFRGIVTAADPGVSFTIAGLADQGAGAFVDANTPWYAYVFRDSGGVGAAPQGETKKILSYVSATGLFTTEAFSVAVAVGDDILIMNERLAATPEIKAETALILADTTSILVDTATTLDNKIDSILEDTTALNDPTSNAIASAVWAATVDEDNIGAAQTTAKTKLQGIWNYLFKKRTVTATQEAAYEKDNASIMETWTLADDDTTASKTP
jgi:hypothetical protein